MIEVQGQQVEAHAGETFGEALRNVLSGKKMKSVVACACDGALFDLSREIPAGATCLEPVTLDSPQGLSILRHSAAHIMAEAVKELFPTAKVTIGPSIGNGFYYDFDYERAFTPEDLEKIEERMARSVAANSPFMREEMSAAEAKKLFAAEGETYKQEIIDDLGVEHVSIYRHGNFTDLCRGPHLPSTGFLQAFKLTSAAGAYWRGDSKNKMLHRIYGTAFPDKKELNAYLAAVEEAKTRDHNKLGRELEYFTTADVIGQGLPILLPKGARVIQILQRFVEDEEQRRGYLLTKTPLMAKSDLYKISGHWDHYLDSMFILGDPHDETKECMALRPMTCPFQYQVFLNRMRSYRDLPMRLNETSTLFRNESSGEMHGLIRVRQFTISEGHLIVRPDQLEAEFKGCLELAKYMLEVLGLEQDCSYRFSQWDPNNSEKYEGTAAQWNEAQGVMSKILNHLGVKYTVGVDEAAFYGPKLDIQIRNVFGKEDTLVTIQIDMLLAARFGMEYVDQNGQKALPYIIHRTSMGCYERTLALLIEKYAGALPVWMAPEQVRILTVTENHDAFARQCCDVLRGAGFRAELDLRNEKLGYKIREARMEKIPYSLVIGDQEVEESHVNVRPRGGDPLGMMPLDAFIKLIREECAKPFKHGGV